MLVAALLAVALAQAPATPAEWDCVSRPTWPAGYLGEFVYVPSSTGNARQLAADRAREEIIHRVCGALDCPSLRGEVALWRSGEARGTACALVLIPEAKVAAWRRAITAQDLEPQLTEVVRALFGSAQLGPGSGKLAVAIDKVNDVGVSGGARAEWLRDRLAAVLARQEALELREVPAGWANTQVPPGLSAVLFASTFERQEGQEEILEVNWKARFAVKGGATYLKTAGPVYVPMVAAPPGPAFEARGLLEDPTLSIRLETPAGGSLCPGENAKLQLWSSVDRHFLVFNLYGKDQALLLFPSDQYAEGFVQAGQTLTLGPPQGLSAAPAGGTDAERFLVLAATKKEALGALARYQGQCRLSAADAAKVWRPERLPASVAKAMDGYRILGGGERCGKVEAVDPKLLEKALAALPACKPVKR